MQYESKVENLCFKFAVFAVDSKHVQDIFGSGQIVFRRVYKERALSFDIIFVGLIAIPRQKREEGYQLQTLTQHVVERSVVGFRVVGIERQYASWCG